MLSSNLFSAWIPDDYKMKEMLQRKTTITFRNSLLDLS